MTEEQNSLLAEKLIKRLEAVGMRTSYRELYDIFLSKTTNSRPVGLVFRRRANNPGYGGCGIWGDGGVGGESPRARTVNAAISTTNEFEWSKNFLQGLSIKCREYEFDRKVPFGAVIDLKEEGSLGHRLVSFLPPPNVDTSSGNLLMSDYLNDVLDGWKIGYNCSKTSPMMTCIDTPFECGGSGLTHAFDAVNDDFLSNRILCSLVEQSMGLVFIRREKKSEDNMTTTTSGSGFAVVRKEEGSWSAPCFLTVLGNKDGFVDGTDPSLASQPDDVKMIIIRNTAMVLGLISGNAVKFIARKDDRANVLVRDVAVIGLHEGRFQLANDFFVAVKADENRNQSAYTLSTDHIEASDILTGVFAYSIVIMCNRSTILRKHLTLILLSHAPPPPPPPRNSIPAGTICRLLRSPAEPRTPLLHALASRLARHSPAILRRRLGRIPPRARVRYLELRDEDEARCYSPTRSLLGRTARDRHLRSEVQVLPNGRCAGDTRPVGEEPGVYGGEGPETHDQGSWVSLQLVVGTLS